MPVTLKPEQQAWLERQVQDGYLPSVKDGVQHAVADMMAIETDDLAWACSYVDAARADIKNGDVITDTQIIARLRSRPAS